MVYWTLPGGQLLGPGLCDSSRQIRWNILFTCFFPQTCYDSTWLKAEKVCLTLLEVVNSRGTWVLVPLCLHYQPSWQDLGGTVKSKPLMPWPCPKNLHKQTNKKKTMPIVDGVLDAAFCSRGLPFRSKRLFRAPTPCEALGTPRAGDATGTETTRCPLSLPELRGVAFRQHPTPADSSHCGRCGVPRGSGGRALSHLHSRAPSLGSSLCAVAILSRVVSEGEDVRREGSTCPSSKSSYRTTGFERRPVAEPAC